MASRGRWLERASSQVTVWAGSSWAFGLAFGVILVWAVTGPIFHFSDTWQLVINTGTTIVTFLMVFLIQNTQNRDARALHLKLDEIIRAIESARNELIDIERLSDDDLETLSKSFEKIRMECESRTRRGNRTNAEHERKSEGTSVESSVD